MNPVKTLILTCVWAGLFGCATGYDTATVDAVPEPVRQSLARAVGNGHRAGIGVALINPKGRHIETYGVVDADRSEPFTAHSQVGIGSITKVFTADLLAILAEEHRVALDQDIAAFRPQDGTAGGIRLWHLATHRAGLPRDIPVDALNTDRPGPLLALLETATPSPEPSYSSAGMAILGLALEDATGRTLSQLIDDRLAAPMGLTNTGYTPDPDRLADPHEGLVDIGGSVSATPAVARGAGGLYASTVDLAEFVEHHLDPIAAEAAWVESTLDGVQGSPLGWQLHRRGDVRIFHHGGDGNGYQSFIGFRPDNGVGVVVVSNSAAEDELQQLAQHLLLPDSVPLPTFDYPPTTDLDEAEMRPYVGRYRFVGDTNTVTIHIRDGQLIYSEYTGQGDPVRTARMYASRGGGFHLRQIPLYFEFDVEGGVAVRARLTIQGQSFGLERI